MTRFELVSDFKPMGDQPEAIAALVDGLNQGEKFQTLLGATGTGKTYAIAVDGNGVCAADLATTHASTEELVFIQPVYDSNGDSTNRGIFVLEGGAANLLSGASA